MTRLYQLFRFYINSSIHVALAVVSLAWVTALYFGLNLDKIFVSLLFFGTVSGYNFVKYADVARWHHRSLTPGLRYIQIFSFICGLAFLVCLSYMPIRVWLWGGVFGVLTLLYALPVFSRKRTLRGVKGVKIYIIALVWAGATVILPLVYAQWPFTTEFYLFFAQRLLFVWVLTLPFEIRDLKYDDDRLQTLPQLMGVKGVKWLGSFLMAVMIAMIWLSAGEVSRYLLSSVLIGGVTALGLWQSSREQPAFYAAFWIEGISILWLGVYALLLGLLA
ncbi:MAG: hypothetical protein ABNH00_04050 [Dokdonia sp.]|jgi:hypothetical protein